MAVLSAFAVGVFSVVWWPQLPAIGTWVVIVLGLMPLVGHRILRLLPIIAAGMLWGVISAHQADRFILPLSMDKTDVLVVGHVIGLVDRDLRRSRFRLRVDSAISMDEAQAKLRLKVILINLYAQRSADVSITSGQRLKMVVRLRRPRGALNPGGFDYQAWLYQQGIGATGYVRRVIDVSEDTGSAAIVAGAGRWSHAMAAVSRQRERISQAIHNLPIGPPSAAALAAITVGDRRHLAQWWGDLARLGIVHLMVISGLHIGLIAAWGWHLGALMARLAGVLCNRWIGRDGAIHPLRLLPPVSAAASALGYSLLSGLSLSTQRALIALLIVMLAKLALRRVSPANVLACCLCAIAVVQPLAALNAGFWLSFVAVLLLIFAIAPWASREDFFRQLSVVQWHLWIGLSLPLLALAGQLTWLAPWVNLVAVPWLSVLTIPLAMLGTALFAMLPRWAEWLWLAADVSLRPLWLFLDVWPANWGFFNLPVVFSWSSGIAVGLACSAIILPSGTPCRWLLGLPLITLLVAPRAPAALQITVLDVGQGLAVVVETAEHLLIYDTGPKYSPQLDAGSAIIAPFLRRGGHRRIDMLIVSHEDSDHSGGYLSLSEAFQIPQVLVGPGFAPHQKNTDKPAIDTCTAGQSWSWDSVSFKVLAPPADAPRHGNNSSCVIYIEWRGHGILLPGDIEKSAEKQLLAAAAVPKSLDLVLAPHHGSKTSSSAPFVAQMTPRHVIFSSGYLHQFGHPHAQVSERYRVQGSQLWSTAEQGAIVFSWSGEGLQEPIAERQKWQPHWR
ncbi:MAG: DNA internalization-related competence protein ComEC/Rec2 [Cellvibrionales bacterium]|nr:DNA internalization-related competence protein ComEC/Rec2 [Porticoccaceae bacterium]